MTDVDAKGAKRRICVLLLQLGGPETLDDIEPFLRNLFEDVLPVPRFARKRLARFFARRRAPHVQPYYERLGGGSPLLANTSCQASALESRLGDLGYAARALVCMRYASPRAADALGEARRDWADALWVALPLYPQYSFATTRSSMRELTALLTTAEQSRFVEVNAYPESAPYLDAMAECVREGLDELSCAPADARLVFSAHGLPVRQVKQGDPYPEHIDKTVQGILSRLDVCPKHELAFQSRVGPVRWLTPSLEDTIRRLGAEGVKNVVVVPVSFVSDHLETLHELDIQFRDIALEAGVLQYVRAPTVGTRAAFIDALAREVVHALPGNGVPSSGRGPTLEPGS